MAVDPHVNGSVNGDPFDISLDPTQFTNDSAPFLGVVTIDQTVPGGSITNNDGTQRETGPQWQLGVRPVHFALQGETGAYLTWASPSTKKNSKISAIIKAMAALPTVFPKTMKIAKGQMVGITCWWVRRDIEFGNMTARNVLVPIREASDTEIEEAGESLRGTGVVAAQAHEYTDEEKTLLVGTISGKTMEDAQLAAAKSRNLPQALKAAVLSGEAITSLMATGDIEMNVDGTITETATAAA